MGSAIASVDCEAQDVNVYNISEEEVSEWLYTPAETIMATIIIPTILCLGITTNFSFFFVILRSAKMKINITIYLAHLAFGDLLFLTLYAAFEIWRFLVTPVVSDLPIKNPAALACLWTVANTGYYASIALVTMVSVERYLALCRPIKHLKIRSRQRSYRLVALCWLVGLVFSGVLATRIAFLSVKCIQWPHSDLYRGFPSKIVELNSNDDSIWNYYIQPLQNIPWFIAMVGNMYMYVKMICVLNKRREISGIDKNQKALQVRNQVAKMLIVNGIIFFMCQTPYNVIALSRWICLLADVPNPVSAFLGSTEDFIVNVPVLINNFVNPLIYGAMNARYREAFMIEILCKGKRRQRCLDGAPVVINAVDKRYVEQSVNRTETHERI